jgi:hypothetical protein
VQPDAAAVCFEMDQYRDDGEKTGSYTLFPYIGRII